MMMIYQMFLQMKIKNKIKNKIQIKINKVKRVMNGKIFQKIQKNFMK